MSRHRPIEADVSRSALLSRTASLKARDTSHTKAGSSCRHIVKSSLALVCPEPKQAERLRQHQHVAEGNMRFCPYKRRLQYTTFQPDLLRSFLAFQSFRWTACVHSFSAISTVAAVFDIAWISFTPRSQAISSPFFSLAACQTSPSTRHVPAPPIPRAPASSPQ